MFVCECAFWGEGEFRFSHSWGEGIRNILLLLLLHKPKTSSLLSYVKYALLQARHKEKGSGLAIYDPNTQDIRHMYRMRSSYIHVPILLLRSCNARPHCPCPAAIPPSVRYAHKINAVPQK